MPKHRVKREPLRWKQVGPDTVHAFDAGQVFVARVQRDGEWAERAFARGPERDPLFAAHSATRRRM